MQRKLFEGGNEREKNMATIIWCYCRWAVIIDTHEQRNNTQWQSIVSPHDDNENAKPKTSNCLETNTHIRVRREVRGRGEYEREKSKTAYITVASWCSKRATTHLFSYAAPKTVLVWRVYTF